MSTALNLPAIKKRFSSEGSDIVASTPEKFSAFLGAEVIKWAKVAKAAGLRPE